MVSDNADDAGRALGVAKRSMRPRRRVMFAEAVRRILRQGARMRMRSVPALMRQFAKQFAFAAGTVIPLAPRTLAAARTRCRYRVRACAYDLYGAETAGPLAIYVHGGAWGTGRASHHALLARALANATDGPVAVADQRVWPAADMGAQAADVAAVIADARARFPERAAVLVAHSSGAHSAALALARGAAVDAAVLQAGVYDPLSHFVFEARRGVEAVSPMAPAAGADADVVELARFAIARCLRARRVSMGEDLQERAWNAGRAALVASMPLEGDMEARCLHLSPVTRDPDALWSVPFGTFIMAAAEDSIVPLSSSARFAEELRVRGVHARLLVYTHMEHQDFALDWARSPAERIGVLDIDESDRARRSSAMEAAYGRDAVELAEENLNKAVPRGAHTRDLWRIIRAVEKQMQRATALA